MILDYFEDSFQLRIMDIFFPHLVFFLFYAVTFHGVVVSHQSLWKSVNIYVITLVTFMGYWEGSFFLYGSLLLTGEFNISLCWDALQRT